MQGARAPRPVRCACAAAGGAALLARFNRWECGDVGISQVSHEGSEGSLHD